MKPLPYAREPKTLGEYLKKRRLELGLRQRDIRIRFNLEKETYATWEKDRNYPSMRHWPGIIALLGYDPHGEPQTVGEKLLAYRRRNGLARNVLAKMIGCDEGTLWKWEDGREEPRDKHRAAVSKLLK